MFKLSNSSKQRREGVDPRLIEISDLAIQIAVGDFSNQLTIPTLPDTFVTVDSTVMTVIGRTSAGGGGNRVCVDNYHRGLSSGNEWRVKNTGQQLDGTSTILVINAVNVQMVVFGTWK